MRSRKALKNTIVLILYEIVSFVCNLIIPRMILGSFGSEYNGISTSITQFLSFITILQAGVGGSTRVVLYKALAEKDSDRISQILKANEAYMRKIAFAFLVYVCVLACTYSLFAQTTISWKESATLIIIIGISTFAQYYFGITYQTLLKADQRNYIYYIMQTGAVTINALLVGVLISFGASIHIVKLFSSTVYCLVPIGLNIYTKKRYHLNMNCKPDHTALNQKWDVMAHSIANTVDENTDLIILTIFANVKVVSVYTVYYLVMNGIKKIMTVFTASLEAAFGNIWVKKEMEAFERTFEVYELLMGAFISIAFTCTARLLIPFVRLYTSGIMDIDYINPTFGALAIFGTAAYCFRTPYVTIVQATGRYKETRNGAIFEALINVVISVVFVIRYGIVGVTLGTIAAHSFRSIQYVSFCYRNILHESAVRAIRNLIWLLCNSLVIFLLTAKLVSADGIMFWRDWVICALGHLMIACGVTLISSVIFYSKECSELFHVCKKLVCGRKSEK